MHRGPIELLCPTPVRRLPIDAPAELWVKDDSKTYGVYGGNKPRKLAHLLHAAQEREARRLITVGAIGSHHVLATGLLGQRLGLPTLALTLARPYSAHAEQTTLQTLAAGVELVPLGSPLQVAAALARLARRGDFFIPPGGSNALGSMGYLEAAYELKSQIDQELLPEPDVVVVALGSGGTAAGLLAGFAALGFRTRLLAVPVLRLPFARFLVQSLAGSVLRLHPATASNEPDLAERMRDILRLDARWLGRGYGHPTSAGELAVSRGVELGLSLEGTYTGKAFACALALLRGLTDRGNVEHQSVLEPAIRRGGRILFWSTFSGVPLAATQGSQVTLPPALKPLLRAP